MFIMNKDRNAIIKVTKVWLRPIEESDCIEIIGSNGTETCILGTYDDEYAKEELQNLLNEIENSDYKTYTMSDDDKVNNYYDYKKKFKDSIFEPSFDPTYKAIEDDSIPF